MELTRFIDANSFKTQPFVPSEEESDRANARALEAGISGIADVANAASALGAKRTECGVSVVIVANSSSTEPVKIPTEDPAEFFVAKPAHEDEPTIRPLQLQENGEPLIAAPLRLCAKMGVPSVTVILPESGEHAQSVKDAVEQALSQLDGITAEFVSLREVPGNVEIFDFDASLLTALLDAAEADGARMVLALDACAPRIQPRHLAQLFDDLRQNPESEIVTSWSAWARHYPFLFSVAFLKKLRAVGWNYTARAQRESAGEGAGGCAAACGNSGLSPSFSSESPVTPLLDVRVKDSVFGEERLDVSSPTSAPFAEFAAEAQFSALEAVALSRKQELCESDEERVALTESLTEADKRLLSAANMVRGFAKELAGRVRGEGDAREDSRICEEAFPCEDVSRGQESFAADRAWAAEWGARNKADFPLFAQRSRHNSLAYLDTAATSQRCYQAIHAEHEFEQSENANVYRGSYDLSMQATFHMNDARAVLESWINADRRQTVLTANTTASLNLVAQAWGERNIGEGDLIIIPFCEHHSNLLPWMLLTNRKHARIGYLPVLPNGELYLEAYRELLMQKPKLVCVAHIGNVLGIANPVKEMAHDAHQVGARFVLDAAQSFPHMKLDVKELGADFVAFSAHKAYGPNGIGGLWISPDAAEEMEPLAGGGGTVSHVGLDSYYWRAGAIQYEAGTPPLSQLFGFAAAVEYLDALGVECIERHSRILTQLLMGLCQKLGFVRVWGHHDTKDSQTGLVSMSVAGVNSSAAGAMLGKMGVAVRSGAHCAHPLAASMGLSGTIRVSFGVYNTPDDVLAACAALAVAHDLGQQEK